MREKRREGAGKGERSRVMGGKRLSVRLESRNDEEELHMQT